MVTQVLSADSHVLEPPDLWTTRMEKKFRDDAPHVVKDFDGRKGDFFVCPPLRPFNPFSLGCAGVPPADQERLAQQGYAACRPGSWDPVERLKDMDHDGLGAEIFYCGYGMSMFGHPDDAFQRDAHRAFNDWAAEYASYAPERLFPIANISMTDPVEDLKEVERVMKLGFRGIFISNDPAPERRYDNPMWEPFWTAIEEYGLPVNVHILTGQSATGQVNQANPLIDGVLLMVRSYRTISEMATGGVLDKHPNLKVISVENDIGWLPGFLKRMDWYSYRFGPRYPQMAKSGGDYWRTQIYSTFQDDEPGVRLRDMLGVTQLMWGSDYPHFDSTFPNSQDAIARNFEGVPEDELDLMLGGNMVRVYGLEEVFKGRATELVGVK